MPNIKSTKKYRFGFLLATTLGNMTRYLNLRKYVERDDEVECVWAPVNHFTPADFPSKLRFLPDPLFLRVRVLQQAAPVINRIGSFDAIFIHLFEGEMLTALRGYVAKNPVLISSTDEAPIIDRENFPLYPQHMNKPVWRQKFRLALDMWRIRRFDYFLPFSQWVADVLVKDCGAPPESVAAIHVGLDLELWHCAPKSRTGPSTMPKILFVGGDFQRKGGGLLLKVFEEQFSGRAELHIVSMQAPHNLPAAVFVYRDFKPGDPRLVELFRQCDLMAMPTRADYTPWAFLEAMAMRLPVIGTDTGSLKEYIKDGETGLLVKIDDPVSLAGALEKLISNQELRLAMGERGRALVEKRYSAASNIPIILKKMKELVDSRRS